MVGRYTHGGQRGREDGGGRTVFGARHREGRGHLGRKGGGNQNMVGRYTHGG
jgi:hypothetical protein